MRKDSIQFATLYVIISGSATLILIPNNSYSRVNVVTSINVGSRGGGGGGGGHVHPPIAR